jgi:hypothetical protein
MHGAHMPGVYQTISWWAWQLAVRLRAGLPRKTGHMSYYRDQEEKRLVQSSASGFPPIVRPGRHRQLRT